MTQGKRLQVPVYLLTDTQRPSPNFLVDTPGIPKATTLYAWTDMKKATEYAVLNSLKHFDIAIIHSEQEFRGVLSAVLDRHPTVEWLHWDPCATRRSPRRFRIQAVLEVTRKEKG